jgi:hypothetical protein
MPCEDSELTAGLKLGQTMARLKNCERLSNVEAIKVHPLFPGRYKVVDELFLRIRTFVHFGQYAELRVSAKNNLTHCGAIAEQCALKMCGE